ncbi:hypothetical protein Vi05172_g11821 [Venturia inaequalis]|nr:hypothetical protein Vi05172_g11821 [Venturia inaequalis]
MSTASKSPWRTGYQSPRARFSDSETPDNDEKNWALTGELKKTFSKAAGDQGRVISANRTRLVVAGTCSEEPEERDGARGVKTGWAGKRGPERGE